MKTDGSFAALIDKLRNIDPAPAPVKDLPRGQIETNVQLKQRKVSAVTGRAARPGETSHPVTDRSGIAGVLNFDIGHNIRPVPSPCVVSPVGV